MLGARERAVLHLVVVAGDRVADQHAQDALAARDYPLLQGAFLLLSRYEELAAEYDRAGCALGIFGTTDKTARVIPNKAFQALACGTPLVVARRDGASPARAVGVVHLKDVVKPGMRDRFDVMRAMGIRTVMITGDNALTGGGCAVVSAVGDVTDMAAKYGFMTENMDQVGARPRAIDDELGERDWRTTLVDDVPYEMGSD